MSDETSAGCDMVTDWACNSDGEPGDEGGRGALLGADRGGEGGPMSSKREWTSERHAAAKARCARATVGPWKWWTSNSHRRLTAEDCQDGGVAYGTKQKDGCGDIVIGEHDMAFIEEARVDLPDALEEIERLRGRLANVEGVAATCDGMMETINQQAAEIARLRAEAESDRGMYAGQLANVAHGRDAALAEVERLRGLALATWVNSGAERERFLLLLGAALFDQGLMRDRASFPNGDPSPAGEALLAAVYAAHGAPITQKPRTP